MLNNDVLDPAVAQLLSSYAYQKAPLGIFTSVVCVFTVPSCESKQSNRLNKKERHTSIEYCSFAFKMLP